MSSKQFTYKAIAIMIGSLCFLLMPQSVFAQSGSINWNNWQFKYEVGVENDGIAVMDVEYQGKKILERGSFPAMPVYYQNNDCGPYLDRLDGDLSRVEWANNDKVVSREFRVNGEQWYELGIRQFIGQYDIYQVWYFNGNGIIDAHLFSRGLQCRTFHEHYPHWRFDFDISGGANDQIQRRTRSGLQPYTTEFNVKATAARNHDWVVRDTVTGDYVELSLDSGTWNVDGQVVPETTYAKNRVAGRLHQDGEEDWGSRGHRSLPSSWNGGRNRIPLGAPKAGRSDKLDELAAYVNSLTKVGDSPDRASNGTLTNAGRQGEAVFQNQGCAACHMGNAFTDSASNTLHDIGTIKSSSGKRLGGNLSGLDTPTLLGLWSTAPYLHNGSASTLANAVNAHDGINISGQEMNTLVSYLRQLDDGAVQPGSGNPTPTPTPPSGDSQVIYVSSTTGGNVNGISFSDEDILAYDTAAGSWTLYFDGSDVGLGNSSAKDVDAFHLLDDGSILLSITAASTLPDVGAIDDSDIVRFVPTELGSNTAGSFEWYFDGSDVNLAAGGEDVDAITVLQGGDLLVSTVGSFDVGTTGKDEDILRFKPTSIGTTTAGSWSLYFDGSDVGLNNSGAEDTWGISATTGGENLYLSTKGAFNAEGISGDGSDIIACRPGQLGANTSCTISLHFDGSANSIGSEVLDGITVQLGSTIQAASQNLLTVDENVVYDLPDASDDEELLPDYDEDEEELNNQIFVPFMRQ